MKGNKQLVARIFLAGAALVLAVVLLTSPTASKRVDSTVLLLVAAAALIILVPWDKLASLKAVGVEITLNLPQVREAVNSLDRISQATGGEAVDNGQVLRALERLGDEVDAVGGSRILWIDDNPTQIVGVRRLLRALGADIHLVTSTCAAEELLAQDNDFDLIISDLMRNAPAECTTFEWICADADASILCDDEVIVRDNGTGVNFEVRSTTAGTRIHQRREGVNFILRLRSEDRDDPVSSSLPVLFYASFSWTDAVGYANPAQLTGFETHVTNSAETLIPAAIQMLASSRASPIAVGGAKKLVKR